MDSNNENISKALILLNSLKREIITMQSDTVSIETLIANLFKYFAVLKDEIAGPDVHSSGIQGQLEEIFHSLTACKDLVLRHKSSGDMILRQADLVNQSCLQTKSDTAKHTYPDTVAVENSITLQEFKNVNAGSDSDDNDTGSLGDFACLDVTVKNEDDNADPLGNESSEGLGNQSFSEMLANQTSEGFGNQSLIVVNETLNIPTQEVTNRENPAAGLLLKCEHCDEIYESEMDLNSHLQSHSQDNNTDTLRCKECRKNFNSKQALTYHLRHSKSHKKKLTKTCKTRASSRKPISENISAKSKLKPSRSKQKQALTGCTECGKCFKTVKALDVHMVQKHKGGRFTCGQCNKAYRSKAALEYHLTASNAHKNQVKIEEEQIEMADNDSKSAVMVSNENAKEKSVSIAPTKEKLAEDIIEKKYSCNVCGEGYKSRSGLWRHRKKTRHLKSKVQKLEEFPFENYGSSKGSRLSCEICGLDFANIRSLTKHLLLKHPIGQSQRPRPFICEQCGKTCTSKWCLKLHVDNIHKTPVLKTCEVCGVQLPKLKHHMTLHAEKKYKCPQCGKEFRWKGNLRRHLELHNSIKPHMCEICGKAYVQMSNLTYHMASHFNSKTEFRCDVCGKGFVHKALLTKHEVVHSEAKFSCKVCGKSFKRNGDLQKHKFIHTGEKTHKCKICGEMFLHDSVLGRHVRKHKGLKPHLCPHCGKAFIDSWGRKQHRDRCPHRDQKCKENCDGQSVSQSPVAVSSIACEPASEAALSPVPHFSPIACEPVLTESAVVYKPRVDMNIGQFIEHVSPLTQSQLE